MPERIADTFNEQTQSTSGDWFIAYADDPVNTVDGPFASQAEARDACIKRVKEDDLVSNEDEMLLLQIVRRIKLFKQVVIRDI